MAVTTRAVTGKVLDPGGTAIPGKIVITLTEPGTTDDGGTEQVVQGSLEVDIDSAGDVSFTLVPNDAITPSGTRYVARFYPTSGIQPWTERWNLTGTGAIDIGDITRE